MFASRILQHLHSSVSVTSIEPLGIRALSTLLRTQSLLLGNHHPTAESTLGHNLRSQTIVGGAPSTASELQIVRWVGKSTRPKGTERLTVKTTTKAHRFSHYIKCDRERELRGYWQETREVQNQAFIQRYINFSRIYARFRDLRYLQITMKEWDVAIERLFSHSRGKQPANDLVRKHPYLLNVKIKPLQFAKNAIKGHLPLYDWRLVLRDLNKLVAEPGTQDASDLQSESDRSYQENKTVTASLGSALKDDWLDPAPEISRQKRKQAAA